MSNSPKGCRKGREWFIQEDARLGWTMTWAQNWLQANNEGITQ